METKEMIEINDLEPIGEVKGGGDVNGDGVADVIVGAGPGAPGGHVKASSIKNDGALLASFFAFQ